MRNGLLTVVLAALLCTGCTQTTYFADPEKSNRTPGADPKAVYECVRDSKHTAEWFESPSTAQKNAQTLYDLCITGYWRVRRG